MSRVGFYTFGVLSDPSGPNVQGFFDRVQSVFETAEGAGGFVARAVRGEEGSYGLFGEYVVPKFYTGSLEPGQNRVIQTLSIWEEVEAVFIFANQGVHSEALRRRSEWVPDADYPNHTGWWVDDDHVPTWEEACERHQYLHDHGSTGYAFSLRSPFDAQGDPMTPDRARMNQYQKISKR